jgi:hypothetical protein
VDWQKQTEIRQIILRGEEAARAGRVDERDAVAVMVRDRQRRMVEEQQRAESERLEREQAATDAHRARLHRDLEVRQAAQTAWAQTRDELRTSVAELRNAVAAAENRANSADDAEAAAGVLDLAVAERRLARAEQAYAQHASRSPY